MGLSPGRRGRPPRRPRPERRRPRWLRAFLGASPRIRALIITAILVVIWGCTNWLYQVWRKPTELLFPVSGAFGKTPAQTWHEYAPIFRAHATRVVTPPLLAALAQVETAGNPLVRTYWRWAWIAHPFKIYRPASSAVGMYQMTDATFEEARHYCVRDHLASSRPCTLPQLYSRLIPSHAVQLTAAYLDMHISGILSQHRLPASLAQRQDLAAVIHLCGPGAAAGYAQRGFHFAAGERCGDHDPLAYVARVRALKVVFAQLAAQDR